LFEENEKKYFPLIEKLKLTEENRISFVKFHFERFAKCLEEYNNAQVELVSRMNNALVEIKEDEDMKLFDEKFNFLYKNNERIPREEFLNYDIYRRNLEKLMAANIHLSESHHEETNEVSNEKLSDKEKLVDIVFNEIRIKDDEIAIEDLGVIMNNLNNNLSFSKLLIDRLLVVYKKKLSINIPNYQNFHHLSNILLSVINNIDMNNEFFELNFAIIYISEKTYYLNPNNKTNRIYLCNYISKNKLISNRSFWVELIEIKICSMVEQRIDKENKYKFDKRGKLFII
jgi:hypothetical protein